EYKQSALDTLLLEQIKKEKPDIIQFEQINAIYAVKHLIPHLKKLGIILVLDEHNVEYIAFQQSLRSVSLIKKIVGKIISANFTKIEGEMVKTVNHVLACSDIDKQYFASIIKAQNISVIPNGVDYKYFQNPKTSNKNTLLFMGGTSYPPN